MHFHVCIPPEHYCPTLNALLRFLDTNSYIYFSQMNLLINNFCNVFSAEEASKKYPFPCPCTYRTALSHYLDITSVPRTHVLRELAEYAGEEKDKEFLLQITSPTPEGKVP